MNDNPLMNKPVPTYYARCYKEECPKADNCLRHLAMLRTTADTPFINIVNPASTAMDSTSCPYFQSAVKLHYAWGISHLLDKVPFKDGKNIRSQLVGHFGKSQYYRFHRRERPLTPDDQNYIRQVFLQKGITEPPVFDCYFDDYDW